MLLTTELVTTLLFHGRGDAWLDVQVESARVTVGVSDSGDGEVKFASRYLWPEHGHGLKLVDALSHRWGVGPMSTGAPGKRVWFETAPAA